MTLDNVVSRNGISDFKNCYITSGPVWTGWSADFYNLNSSFKPKPLNVKEVKSLENFI